MAKALTEARTLIVFARRRVPDPVVHARASPTAVHQVNHLFDAALTDGEGQALLPDTKLTSEGEDAEPRVESVAELGQNGIIRELVT
ncbi:hypothetical protein ABZ917_18405 [Nonomuraea wenchangensis]